MGINWLGLAAVICLSSAISVVDCGERKVSPGDYLLWPKVDYNKDDFHATVREAIQKLVDEDWIRFDPDHRAQIERISQASKSDRFSRDEREIYRRLSLMRIDCGWSALNLFQSLWVQMQDKRIPEEFEPIIRRIGASSFESCSHKRRKYPIDTNLAWQFDRVFAAAFNMDHDDDLGSRLSFALARALKDFDLATSSFNAKQLLETIRGLTSGGDSRTAEPLDLLKDFMLSRCDKFDEELKLTIMMEDLAREFGSSTSGPSPTLWLVERMDEYNRLCLALRSTEKQEAIRKNLLVQQT